MKKVIIDSLMLKMLAELNYDNKTGIILKYSFKKIERQIMGLISLRH